MSNNQLHYTEALINVTKTFHAAAVRVSNKEPCLSDLKEDCKVMKLLETLSDCSAFGSIRDLTLTFSLTYKERSNILTSVLPCRGFFRHFFKWKSSDKTGLKLSDIQYDIEESCTQPNKSKCKIHGKKRSKSPSTMMCRLPNRMIFRKVLKDVDNRRVSFTLSSSLGELKEDPESMKYITQNIVDNLSPEERTQLPTWKDVGYNHGYIASDFNDFYKVHKNEETAIERLLSTVCEKEPLLPISCFIERLTQIRRNDIARVLENWRDVKMVSIALQKLT